MSLSLSTPLVPLRRLPGKAKAPGRTRALLATSVAGLRALRKHAGHLGPADRARALCRLGSVLELFHFALERPLLAALHAVTLVRLGHRTSSFPGGCFILSRLRRPMGVTYAWMPRCVAGK